jgi:hypothetical protein
VQTIERKSIRVVFLASVFFANAFSQTLPKSAFPIRITKVNREADTCHAEAESTTVRFHISSEISSACGMLRAGDSYKPLRATIENEPKDETKDVPTLIIYNNVENPRRQNAVFTIDSEEALYDKN